jgi:predicted Zn-dependent protease
MYTYLENLINRLAQHSELKSRNLDLLLVKNPTMNAFAVPGGVVGVHTGLFLNAETEAQIASVLAHELAHLSQRHFARGLEKQQQNTIPLMAAMLASLVLIATTGGDAGLAALTTTQAAALDSKLRFSRQNEQEADRIGMQTIEKAGLDPNAVAEMFERMMRSSRYTKSKPEFLLTHPVTENRIADARNRAGPASQKQFSDSIDFHLMRARAVLLHTETPQLAVKRFSNELNGESLSTEASRYGLVLALTKSGQYEKAQQALQPLLDASPEKIAYVLAKADIQAGFEDFQKALTIIENRLLNSPNNHPLTVRYAELLMRNGNYALCEEVLGAHVKLYPKDDYVWYLLAEVHGLAGNIYNVHTARAEYFILNGVYDKAKQQLENALKIADGDYIKTSLLKERIIQVGLMMEEITL